MQININKDMLRNLLVMGGMIEARDPYTGGHLWRVSQYAKRLATRMGLSTDEVIQVGIAGYLHDLGNVGVPDHILRKTSTLSPEEFEVLKTHTVLGANIIQHHPLSALAHDTIRHHHERFDANGYPDCLPLNELPLCARIVAIADAFDAMTSTRAYRRGMSKAAALARLKASVNEHFDAELVSHFVALATKGGLDEILLHSDENIPLLHCEVCGPIIAVSPDKKDGDLIHCPSCGAEYRLHVMAHSFALEPRPGKANAIELQPKADQHSIDDLVEQVPSVLNLCSEV